MCLLDQIVTWDAHHILCTASSHRQPHNPLRAQGQLAAVCAIEYAAQAMAAHGGLLATSLLAPDFLTSDLPTSNAHDTAAPRAGYLASVRAVELYVSRLDDISADLQVEAERQSGDDNTILYTFNVSDGQRPLVSGRAIVVLNVAKLGQTT